MEKIILWALLVVVSIIWIIHINKIYKDFVNDERRQNDFNVPSIDVTTTYEDKLNDERWLIRRRQIINRDHSTCCFCKQYTNHPQVHHKYYVNIYGHYRQPWDYPDKALITLCPKCHKRWHETHKNKVYYPHRRYY